MAGTIAREVAAKEVQKWLDFKKVKESKLQKEEYQGAIETMTEAVADGTLKLTPEFEWVHKLAFPISGGEGVTTESFTYKPRLQVREIQQQMAGAKGADGYSLILANLAALSSQPKALLAAMETDDWGVASSIALFFL